jgi:7-keto-8-aminopelargonate synthetase-like enzyme
MRSMGINTGFAEGYAVIPAITGSSLKAVKLSGQLFDAGLNVQPIIHPAVEEKAARLRFFLSSTHSQDDIDLACETVHALMKK